MVDMFTIHEAYPYCVIPMAINGYFHSNYLGSICDKLTERHIPSLLQQLKNHAAKWREIGIHLGFLPGELRNIEARPNLTPGAPKSWLGVMLEEWIQWAPSDSRGSTSFANMDDLKSALKEAGLAGTVLDLKL